MATADADAAADADADAHVHRAFLDDERLMVRLCRACRTEGDRSDLLEFLTGVSELPHSLALRLADPNTRTWNYDVVYLRQQDVDYCTRVVALPHRTRPFLDVVEALFVPTARPPGSQPWDLPPPPTLKHSIKDLGGFLRAWKLPTNAHKFQDRSSPVQRELFKWSLRQPYGDLPSLGDALDALSAYT